jgi:hypothetical protein
LKSTLWERISDLSSYQESLERILAAIYGVTDKPPLGAPPSYTESFVESIGGLSKIDSLVLRLACEHVLAASTDLIDPMIVFVKEDKPIVPEQELRDSMEILEQHHYIYISHTFGGSLDRFRISTSGFETFAQACISDYQDLVVEVASCLVNKRLMDNQSIIAELDQPRILIDHILDVLEAYGHLKQSKAMGGLHHIHSISPSLRRSLQG